MIYTVKRIDEDLDFGCEERAKDDLMTVGVTDAPPLLGMTMPWAPHSNALRMTAPRLWGSSMPSLSTRKGGSPLALAADSRSSTVTYSISLAKAATP